MTAADKLKGTLPDTPEKKRLRELQNKHRYLWHPTHDLNRRLVQACEKALLENDREKAGDILDRLEVDVVHEVNTIQAAFEMFKEDEAETLNRKEIQAMLDYLSFPSTEADVDAVLKFVGECNNRPVGVCTRILCFGDSSSSTAEVPEVGLSLDEFQAYVGRKGGSRKLFELRRRNLEKQQAVLKAVHEKEIRAADLQVAGFRTKEQAWWDLILPRAPFESAEVAKLEVCQKEALCAIRKMARGNHERDLPFLQKKVLALKFTENDLWMALAYIRDIAPVIIHIHLERLLQGMEEDTHYRNQFDTRKSSGLYNIPVRRRWEHNLFEGAYDEMEGFLRPKYGVLSHMNDARGVLACGQYGTAYLVLKDVRMRCTVSPEDSGNMKACRLAVLDYYAHVMNEFTTDELKETLNIATSYNAALVGDSSITGNMMYKEVQIHGEIKWDKHVERLVAHPDHRDFLGPQLEAVCHKHGWQLSWVDEEEERLKAEQAAKGGQDPWRKKLDDIMELVPDVEGVKKGRCIKGCGRRVRIGKNQAGNNYTTCCRGCALGFGHSLACEEIRSRGSICSTASEFCPPARPSQASARVA